MRIYLRTKRYLFRMNPKLPRKGKFTKKTIDFDKARKPNLEIANQISDLLQECWPSRQLINKGKWFCTFYGKKLVAVGQLQEDQLWNLCTHKDFRGQGLARDIIQRIVRSLCKKHKPVVLFVDPSSPRKWYARLGFEYVSKTLSDSTFFSTDIDKMELTTCKRLPRKRKKKRN